MARLKSKGTVTRNTPKFETGLKDHRHILDNIEDWLIEDYSIKILNGWFIIVFIIFHFYRPSNYEILDWTN